MKKTRLSQKNGIMVANIHDLKINQKVSIVQETKDTYIVRKYPTSPLVEVDKKVVIVFNGI